MSTYVPPPCSTPPRAHLAQNLNYNVPGGKLNRGISVVDSFQVLKGSALTEDEYQKAAILGWCVELVGFVLLLDKSLFLTTA